MMQYKGYTGKINFDDQAELFHGEVIDIKDVITFQGKSAKELKKAFRESIDDYLAFCKKRNEAPNKPFTGKFVVRLTPEQHRKVYVASKIKGTSLNSWISQMIDTATQEDMAVI